MKRFLIVGLLALGCMLQCSAKKVKIPTPIFTYDYTQNVTRVVAPAAQAKSSKGVSPVDVSAGFAYDGKTFSAPEFVQVSFQSYHSRVFWSGADAYFRYGNFTQRLHGSWNGAVAYTSVYESLTVFIPASDFIDMAHSTTLFFQIAGTDYYLDDKRLEGFKQLAKLLPVPERAPVTSSTKKDESDTWIKDQLQKGELLASHYDEVLDELTTNAKITILESDGTMENANYVVIYMVGIKTAGKSLTSPKEAILTILRASKKTGYLWPQHNVLVRYSDSLQSYEGEYAATISGEDDEKTYREKLRIILPLDDLFAMAKAKKIFLKIGKDSEKNYVIEGEKLDSLIALANAIKSIKPVAPPAEGAAKK